MQPLFLDLDDQSSLPQLLVEFVVGTLKTRHSLGERVSGFRLAAPFFRLKRAKCASCPGDSPLRQVRAVQALATQQTANAATGRALISLVEDPHLISRGELAARGLRDHLGVGLIS
mgnify:CR=1 FL=1